MNDAEYGFAKQALSLRGSCVKRKGDSYLLRETAMSGFVSQLNMVPETWKPISAETVERLITEGYLRPEDIIEDVDK